MDELIRDKDGELKEHHEEENHHEDSKLKKFFVLIVGVLLIILMLSFVIVSYPVGNILLGQLESEPLKEDRIDLEDFSIIFENGLENEIKNLYLSEQKVEFSLCLFGKKEEGDYHISSWYQPEQVGRFNHVSFEPCTEETLIIFHTHPYKSCIASQTDLNTLEKTKERNENVLMVVMCEPERFSVYN